jgi:hypothetical protein
MLNFFVAEVHLPVYFAGLPKTYRELVRVLFGRENFGDGFLSLAVGDSDAGALVVFWQSVLAAELSAAVGTVKGHEDVLPTFLTVHFAISLFIDN